MNWNNNFTTTKENWGDNASSNFSNSNSQHSNNYNPELDKELGYMELPKTKRGKNPIEIKVFQYNGGKPKIQLSRFYVKNGEKKYTKLGRITLEEAKNIIEAFNTILNKLT